ncbi:MAG TPA: hypothetical protein EYN38_00930, partial [Flavobacteriales bacterium]|nr:hypothetical protein [Flavobacteriales bacterium]
MLPGNVKLFSFFIAFILFSFPSHGQGSYVPTKGKEFWLGFMFQQSFSNAIGTRRIDIFITSYQNTSGVISIPQQGWSQSFTVTANVTTTIAIPISIAENVSSETIENRGVHILTQDTVSVFAINFQYWTADASKILPKHSLGTEYRVSSYWGYGHHAFINTSLMKSEFLIVATEDGTKVEITPSAPTLGGRPAGVPFIVGLDAGETYQVMAATETLDLMGSSVVGTDSSGPCRPFAVFSGTVCTKVPNSCTACDHIFDQNLPVPTWGTTYYSVPFSFASSYTIRVLADQNNTSFTINNGPPQGLNAGQYYETNFFTNAACIQANKPVCVTQYMEGATCVGAGDPAMLILNSEEQKIDNITFSTVTSTVINQHNVNVIMKTAHLNQLQLDGVPVPVTSFIQFPACPTHSYAQLPITQGSHTLISDSGVTAYIYGTGSYESYAYSAGSFSRGKSIEIDSILCTGDTLHLGTTEPMFGHWWATTTFPNDTIHTGSVLTLVPPITPDLYVLHGSEYISGCEQEFYFNVEVPTPPLVNIIQSADTVCQYQPVQLNANTIPFSSIYQFQWTPPSGLNNPLIANPIATPALSTMYVVAVSSPNGCSGIVYDSVYIHVTTGNISSFVANATDNAICLGDSSQLGVEIEETVLEDD